MLQIEPNTGPNDSYRNPYTWVYSLTGSHSPAVHAYNPGAVYRIVSVFVEMTINFGQPGRGVASVPLVMKGVHANYQVLP